MKFLLRVEGNTKHWEVTHEKGSVTVSVVAEATVYKENTIR
jgi:hypothetical protein